MWIWQAITGGLLLVLLGVHMVTQHFIAPEGLRYYEDVVAYLSHPGIFALETAMLIVVVSHALMGVRSILLDLSISERTDTWLKRGLTALGILLVAYGVFMTWQVIR